MNVLTIFDQRITAIFEEGAPGQRKPFSFKRLAKRAVREMEDETFVIDGVDTAPALYTVLISAKDDELMRPMYVNICDEISQLVEAQAKKRGYTFVGRPLVRFMVDPALRGGRFSVFAENVDPRTLARLRDEENVYLGITPPREVPFGEGFVPQPLPLDEEEPETTASAVEFVESEDEPQTDDSSEAEVPFVPEPETELDVLDIELDEVIEEEPASVEASDFEEELELEPADMPVDEDEVEEELEPVAVPEPAIVPDPEPIVETPLSELIPEAIPTTRAKHAAIPMETTVMAPEPQTRVMPARRQKDTCTLTDTATGRTYQVIVRRTPIGRERMDGGIVLRDPNASRRHAELVFENGVWTIRDLGSTNGTLVDDMDVREAVLADGDVITIGLTNLEFRAG